MKKILCLLIALSCAFSLIACGDGDGGTPEIGNPLEEVVASSAPTKIVTLVTYAFADTDPRSEADLNGTYVLEMNGSDSIFTYDYNTFATPEEGLDDWVKNISGKIYVKDGQVSTDGVEWEAASAETINTKFNLVKDSFKTYTKSADEKTLTATITGDNIESVIGYEISATGDITVVVTTDGYYMRSVVISYTSTEGASVIIDTSYSYNELTLNFPAAE